MKYQDLNDYELVSMISENNDSTEILFEKYRPLIYGVAKKQYKNNQNFGIELSDLIQEGMIGFNDAINTFQDHKDTLFFTYAKKCIETKIISYLVSATRKKHFVLNSSISMDYIDKKNDMNILDRKLASDLLDPEQIMIDQEKTKDIIKYLNQELTDFELQTFELKKDGFTYKEIAEILGVSPKKIDNALQRVKNKIKLYSEK